jgi:hypothetical protein
LKNNSVENIMLAESMLILLRIVLVLYYFLQYERYYDTLPAYRCAMIGRREATTPARRLVRYNAGMITSSL